MNEMLSSIITSTVVAAIISSLVSSFVSYRLKNLEFRNEYYKIIIKKRLDSYAFVERTVLLLQNVVEEKDYAKYHEVFSSWSLLNEFKESVRASKYNGIWIVKSTLAIVNEIDIILDDVDNEFAKGNNESELLGKHYFKELEGLKQRLEAACRYDILHLHKIT